MVISSNNRVNKLTLLVVVNGTNFADKLSADSSIGKRNLIFGIFKLGRIVVAVNHINGHQRGARQRPWNTSICCDDGYQVTFLAFAIKRPFENNFAGNRIDFEKIWRVVLVTQDRVRDVAVRSGTVSVRCRQLQDDVPEWNGLRDLDVVGVVSELRSTIVNIFDIEENDCFSKSTRDAIGRSYGQLVKKVKAV